MRGKSPKRLSLKKRVTRELSLWALFALDSECLSQAALSPLPLRAWRDPKQHPQLRLTAQLQSWREDPESLRIAFAHIKNKSKLQQLCEDDQVWELVTEEINHFLDYQSAVDALITQCALRWKINRMGSIDRSILRYGTYELCFKESLPAKAILSESIELGKRYGTADSGRFINGVLDRVAQELGRIERRVDSKLTVSVVHRKR
jgi:transcription antitermination protein NusB